MRPTLASSSTPLLVLGAVAVSTLIVWLSHPSNPTPTSPQTPVVARTAQLRDANRLPSLREHSPPDYREGFYPQVKLALDLLVSWLRGSSEAVQSSEHPGTERGATSG